MVWTKPHERRCPGRGAQAPLHALAHPCAHQQKATTGPGWRGHLRAVPGHQDGLRTHCIAQCDPGTKQPWEGTLVPAPAACSRRLECWETSPYWSRSPPNCTWCQDVAQLVQSTRQAAQALLPCQPSRVSGTCDRALPFTPLCVLTDFALDLMFLCSLDPPTALGPATATVLEVQGRTWLSLQGGQAAGKGLGLSQLSNCGWVPASPEQDLPAAGDQEMALQSLWHGTSSRSRHPSQGQWGGWSATGAGDVTVSSPGSGAFPHQSRSAGWLLSCHWQ